MKSFNLFTLSLLVLAGTAAFAGPAPAPAEVPVEAALAVVSRDGDWLESGWAGPVWRGNAPWYWFSGAGAWYFCVASAGESLWLYNGREGWLWTGSATAPWGYYAATGGWYGRGGEIGTPALWGSREGRWFVLDESFDWLNPRACLAMQFAAGRYKTAMAQISSAQFPYQLDMQTGSWIVNGAWSWTSGFFPGSLLHLYQWTHDADFLDGVRPRLDALEGQKTTTSTHDIGFMIGIPFILAHGITGESRFRDIALAGARSLASRFNTAIGSIDAWDWGEWAGIHDTIVDCMMNLELLLWGARQPGGDPQWFDMAISHADLTARQLIRGDGSVIHIVAFDRRTQAVLFKRDFGGSTVPGAVFARGQAWAIHGYTVLYRETGDRKYYDLVMNLLDYWLAHAGDDLVPTFELSGIFPSTQQAPDTSGTALIASALLDLAGFAPEPDRTAILARARSLLETLLSPEYLGDGPGTGILYHQTNDYSAATKVDTAISYGDYYWLQAMVRYLTRYAGA